VCASAGTALRTSIAPAAMASDNSVNLLFIGNAPPAS
jgi:hypothetical protein